MMDLAIRVPLYFSTTVKCDNLMFYMIDMIQFESMLGDRGVQYKAIFNLELKVPPHHPRE